MRGNPYDYQFSGSSVLFSNAALTLERHLSDRRHDYSLETRFDDGTVKGSPAARTQRKEALPFLRLGVSFPLR